MLGLFPRRTLPLMERLDLPKATTREILISITIGVPSRLPERVHLPPTRATLFGLALICLAGAGVLLTVLLWPQ